MPAGARDTTFDRVLGGLGRVLEGLEADGRGGLGADAGTQAQRAAVAWLVGRTLRPRHVNWPRLLAATAAGVVLGELLQAFGSRRRNGRALPPGRSRVLENGGQEADLDAGPAPRSARAARGAEATVAAEAAGAEAPMDGPRSARRERAEVVAEEGGASVDQVRGFLERAGGDLAVAAAYASIAYPRLPGPPFLRAAVFGAADVVVSEAGGIASTLAALSPRLRLPLARLLPDEARRVERAVALALALGLLYRDEDEEYDED